ncbi:MAG: Maf family nucleotide pyrophosphatase [Bacteroidales bacterium]|nr:Maf family nucleotide pyrophosphatase [Bacteroidales bacterium]
MKVILASASPRRRELLKTIIPEFEIAPSRDIDETYPDTLSPDDVPVYLSALKSAAYADILTDGDVLVTADTVVVLGDRILGKPAGRDDAIAMLNALSGQTHRVITGVSLAAKGRDTVSFSAITEVSFARLSQADIEYYVDNYRPFDKAGAYGIQEWIGAAAVEKISGSYYNVVGLPLHALFTRLREFVSLSQN